MNSLSEILQELAPGYLAARKEELPQMLELLASSNFARLRVLSHSLKGSGGSFGFSELTRFGAALEQHAEKSDSVAFAEELARLQGYLEHQYPPPTAAVDHQASGSADETSDDAD